MPSTKAIKIISERARKWFLKMLGAWTCYLTISHHQEKKSKRLHNLWKYMVCIIIQITLFLNDWFFLSIFKNVVIIINNLHNDDMDATQIEIYKATKARKNYPLPIIRTNGQRSSKEIFGGCYSRWFYEEYDIQIFW